MPSQIIKDTIIDVVEEILSGRNGPSIEKNVDWLRDKLKKILPAVFEEVGRCVVDTNDKTEEEMYKLFSDFGRSQISAEINQLGFFDIGAFNHKTAPIFVDKTRIEKKFNTMEKIFSLDNKKLLDGRPLRDIVLTLPQFGQYCLTHKAEISRLDELLCLTEHPKTKEFFVFSAEKGPFGPGLKIYSLSDEKKIFNSSRVVSCSKS
jgi:hypothetical protein